MTSTPTAATPSEPSGLDEMVALTPAHRDRTVDAVRALCIVVVVCWHWVFSITHLTADGRLSMPNPIDEIPGGWALTWVLQVMPAFFVVGGFANMASWQRLVRDGQGSWLNYARGRTARLVPPIAVVVAVWAVGDTLARSLLGVPSVLEWGMVVFVPLWFLGAYTAVLLLAPVTIRAHERAPWTTLGSLAAVIAVSDGMRFALGDDRWGLLTTAAVWVFAHQVGYLWRDGTVTRWSAGRRLAVVAAAAAALAILTTAGPYPASMVAVRGGEISNMFPTTAPIAVLAVGQLGLIGLVRPATERLLQRSGPWRAVIAVNAVAMTVFAWHMTALVAVIGLVQGLGFRLPATTSATWWLLRPFWLLAPGLVLVGLIAAFARIERPRTSARPGRGADDLRHDRDARLIR